MSDVKNEMLFLSDWVYNRLRVRLEGLDDDEYFWEPVDGCWSVRPTEDGSYRGDWGVIFEETPPFTTIAWRLTHIIDFLTSDRCGYLLGLEPVPSPLEGGPPGTAAAATQMYERAYAIWRDYVAAVEEPALWEKVGPRAEGWADSTRVAFVLHIIDELIHHGAEIGVLRDLYRARRDQDAFVSACLRGDRDAIEAMRRDDASVVNDAIARHPQLMLRAAAEGRWESLPLLAELGFSIEGMNGRTPLHHAAAAGDVEAVRFLVEHGADVRVKDPVYNASPLEWAEYFKRTDAAEYLRALT